MSGMLGRLKERVLSSSPGSGSAATSALPTRNSTPLPTDTHSARLDSERHLAQTLLSSHIPASLEDCRRCSDPCEDEVEGNGGVIHVSYPRNFEIDWESELLGSAHSNDRQLVVSTGKSDWPHDHTEDESTLSHHLAKIIPEPSASEAPDSSSTPKLNLPNGVYESAPWPASKLGLFSSSLESQSHTPGNESIMIFPDWKVVTEVENSVQGAKGFIDDLVINKGVTKSSGSRQVWTMPYRAVVLLCSHKRRDKRCHIAAPLLEKAFCAELEAHGVHVDTKGEALSPESLSDVQARPLSDLPEDAQEAQAEAQRREIEGVDDEEGGGQVGIFRINHLGGHRYAGVMIICFPSGATLYYGRVSPHEIPSVVRETLLKGKILAGLLRSGGNVYRPELGEGTTGAGTISVEVEDEDNKDSGSASTSCTRKGKSMLTW